MRLRQQKGIESVPGGALDCDERELHPVSAPVSATTAHVAVSAPVPFLFPFACSAEDHKQAGLATV